jgi:hypothetical protein
MRMFSFYTKNCISEVVAAGHCDTKLLPLLECLLDVRGGTKWLWEGVLSDCEYQPSRGVMENKFKFSFLNICHSPVSKFSDNHPERYNRSSNITILPVDVINKIRKF